MSGLVIGLVVGAITGLALVWLLRSEASAGSALSVFGNSGHIMCVCVAVRAPVSAARASHRWKLTIIDCIGFHHQASAYPRIEAIVLRDAGALDFLSVMGILRDFPRRRVACEKPTIPPYGVR